MMSSSWIYDHGLKSSLVHGESPLKLSSEAFPGICKLLPGALLAHIVFQGGCFKDFYMSCGECGADIIKGGIPSAFISSVGAGDLYDYEHPDNGTGCKYEGKLMAIIRVAGEIALFSLRNAYCLSCGEPLKFYYSPNNPRWNTINKT